MTEDDVGAWLASLAYAIAMNRKFRARDEECPRVIQAIPRTSAGAEFRQLLDRLNDIDAEGGWGRLRIGDAEFVISGGEFPAPQYEK